ncbi:MAG: AzlD domain-containing protein [Pseudomonadota bacterium]
MLSDWSYTVSLIVLASAAFATRVSGAVLMSRVTPGPKVERFLEGLSVSVIAALVASGLAAGSGVSWAAVSAALVAMALSRSVVWAMLAGLICAIALHHALGLS